MSSRSDVSDKLQQHLNLLKEEYTKLQRDYAELEKKYSQLVVANGGSELEEFSSFISRLSWTVASLYGRKAYSDITIKLKDKTMPAHKFVLNVRSEEWREENIIGVDELDWSDLESDVGCALLRWIYTDIVDLQHDALALGLLRASHKFKLAGLLGLCEGALVSTVGVRSCVRFYCVAEEVSATSLLEYCSSLISTHWDDLTTQDFEHMSGPLLYKMLKSKTKHPLHAAIRLIREDVVFLCLVENDSTLPELVNSLSPQGQLPLAIALMNHSTSIAQTLVQTGKADVNAYDANGTTLLIDAIKRADSYAAKFLLEKECDVNLTARKTLDTALHLVCSYSDSKLDANSFNDIISIGKMLLERNANVNLQNAQGFTSLHIALISGNTDMIDLILNVSTLDADLKTNEEKCALYFALVPPYSSGPPYKLAKTMLEKNANPDVIFNKTNNNLLQHLIIEGYEDASIFLCEYADLNHMNQEGLTALHLACKYGMCNLVEALLNAKSPPNTQSALADMETPVHFAVKSNNVNVVKIFVKFIKTPKSQDDEIPDFNLKNVNGESPLSSALNLGNNELVPMLIEGGADVNARNGQDLTLLHQAILSEDANTAIFLLENGADMNALTSDRESPLQLAIYSGLPTVVDCLCSLGVSFSAPNNRGDPPLWSALESDQERVAAVLVRHGVDADCWGAGPDGCLQTLLHRAIDENKEQAAIFLIKSGCDRDSPRRAGQDGQGEEIAKEKSSPMHLCCQWGLTKVIQKLIEFGANINTLDCDNKTPLHIAIENQHDEIIGILLGQSNIDLKVRDKNGNTAFATALTVRNHKAAQSILERMPNAAEHMDQRGRNFLHIAIMKDDLESVLFLLSIQVDVNSRVHDVNQTPPLHLAAVSKNEMLVRNLILAGARINDKDATQKTALHIAVERGQLAAVSALLQNGCDYDANDSDGNNALHIAVKEGHLQIVRELLLESRINAEAINLKGRNPLHELCRCGKDQIAASICELFLECMPKYPINNPDLQGNTPLLLAFMRGQAPLCKILVKNGACMGFENREGVTIFNYKLATNQLLHKLLDQLPQESPWAMSEACQECGTKFTITMRKHHCRHCGRNLCSKCSNNDIPIIKFGINKPVRVCCVCFEVLSLGSS